jgi:DNA modification methylase
MIDLLRLEVVRMLVSLLIPFVGNSRTHSREQVTQIARSIEAFGFVNPILVGPDNVIIAGAGRLLAARQLGLKEVPVIVLGHLTEAQRRALVIADNQLALNAGWDEESLRIELQALQETEFDLSLIGFDDDELARLLAATEEPTTGLTDEDDIPDAAETPITRLGEIWLMGSPGSDVGAHRVMAGDATDRAQVDRLMNGERAGMIFSDPPYSCDLASTQNIPSRHRDDGAFIANDDLDFESFVPFLRKAFGNMLAVTRPGAVWYVTAPHGPIGLAFSITLHEIGVWRHSLVWVKDSLVMGRMDYHYRHEPIYHGWTPGAAHHPVPTRDQDTVWEIPRPKASPLHPSTKPVALMEKAILNSSDPHEIVLDGFAGVGGTLIAAAKHNRRAFLCELEPRYVDLICKRYIDHFGGQVVLDGDGRTFAEIAQERRQEAK